MVSSCRDFVLVIGPCHSLVLFFLVVVFKPISTGLVHDGTVWIISYHGTLYLHPGSILDQILFTFQDWRDLLQRIHWAEKRGIFSEESPGSFSGQARIRLKLC